MRARGDLYLFISEALLTAQPAGATEVNGREGGVGGSEECAFGLSFLF